MLDKLLYGVWLRGEGWVKVHNVAVAFESKEVAIQTAERVGSNADVFYIDKSLVDLERYLLDCEKNKERASKIKLTWRNKWHILMS